MKKMSITVYLVIITDIVECEDTVTVKAFFNEKEAIEYYHCQVEKCRSLWNVDDENFCSEVDKTSATFYIGGEYVVNHCKITIQKQEVEYEFKTKSLW